jgi:hypothetical protein
MTASRALFFLNPVTIIFDFYFTLLKPEATEPALLLPEDGLISDFLAG